MKNLTALLGRVCKNGLKCVGLSVGVVFLVRMLGLLQIFELSLYDFIIRWNHEGKQHHDIVVVKIELEDTISDAALVESLETVLAAKPTLIGLDIFAERPRQKKDWERLEEILIANKNIIAVEYCGRDPRERKSGPPVLKQAEDPMDQERVGCVDTPQDAIGGIVRRAYLLQSCWEDIQYSLALRLALAYLPPFSFGNDERDPSVLRLGQTLIPQFRSYDGGYVRAEDSGYQYMVDFRDSFRELTLEDVHAKPDSLKGKIVLLGKADPGHVDDMFLTGLTPGRFQADQMLGVRYHAHVLSQLLRFASGESKPISMIPEAGEWLLLILCAVGGLAVGRWQPQWSRVLVSLLIGSIFFVGLSLALFRGLFFGVYWFPVVPAILTWSFALLPSAVARRREVAEIQMTRPLRIFVSYSREDRTVVKQVYKRLANAGYDPWIDDPKIRPGNVWRKEIRKAIARSDVFLACLSKNALGKLETPSEGQTYKDDQILRKEFTFAVTLWQEEKLDFKFSIIPLKLDAGSFPQGNVDPVLEPLMDLQMIDIREKEAYKRLFEELEKRQHDLNREAHEKAFAQTA